MLESITWASFLKRWFIIREIFLSFPGICRAEIMTVSPRRTLASLCESTAILASADIGSPWLPVTKGPSVVARPPLAGRGADEPPFLHHKDPKPPRRLDIPRHRPPNKT